MTDVTALAFRDWPNGSAFFLVAATAGSQLKAAEIGGTELPDVM